MRTAAWLAGLGLVACAAAFVLNLPWSTTWSWDDLVAPSLAGAPGRGLVDVASMAIGRSRFEVLALALYVPVLVALLVARAWRLTWAARAAGLVVVFLGLAILQDRDALPFRVPEIGVLLAPVGLGLAHRPRRRRVAAFGHDVAGRTFGWRQPLGLLGIAAVVRRRSCRRCSRSPTARGTRPRATPDRGRRGAAADATELVADGSRPSVTTAMLYLGDPRLIPFPSTDLGDGVAMALVDDGAADLARPLGGRRPAGRRGAARRVVAQIAVDGHAARRPAARAVRHPLRSSCPVVDGAPSTADGAAAAARTG